MAFAFHFAERRVPDEATVDVSPYPGGNHVRRRHVDHIDIFRRNSQLLQCEHHVKVGRGSERHGNGLALKVLRCRDLIVDDQGFGIVDVVVDVDHLQVDASAIARSGRRRAIERDVDGSGRHGVDHFGAGGELEELDALAAEPFLLQLCHVHLPRTVNQLVTDVYVGSIRRAHE